MSVLDVDGAVNVEDEGDVGIAGLDGELTVVRAACVDDERRPERGDVPQAGRNLVVLDRRREVEREGDVALMHPAVPHGVQADEADGHVDR